MIEAIKTHEGEYPMNNKFSTEINLHINSWKVEAIEHYLMSESDFEKEDLVAIMHNIIDMPEKDILETILFRPNLPEVCETCGEPMIGNGYDELLHCASARPEAIKDLCPTSDPVFC